MRAAQVVRLDGPDGVEVREIGEPVAGPDEVVVDVHAAGLAFPDLLLSQGRYQLRPNPPFTLGIDFAGIVRSAPEGFGFAAGDRVSGWDRIGAAAETIAVSATHVFSLPDSVGFAVGACLPMNYLTAHFALITRGGLQPGETVLVNGAAGGVGSAAVQVAAAYGAHVIAVASTPEKRAAASTAGAHETLAAGRIREATRALTDGRGIDVVVDVVGGTDFATDVLGALAPAGRLLVVGFAGGEIGTVKLNRLLLTNTDVRGVAWGPWTRLHPRFSREQWDQLSPRFADGRLAPRVDAVRPLDQVREALADLAARRTLGKTVVSLR